LTLAQDVPRVRLLSISDPAGQAALEGRSADALHSLDPLVQSSAYVLTNADGQTVAGYVIEWTASGSGEPLSFYQAFDENELFLNPGRKVSGFGLEPGKTRLILPFGNFHESQFADSRSVPDLSQLHTLSPLVKRLSGRSLTAQLDSTIYADGRFDGPDRADLVHSFTIERNAKHDAGAAVLLALREGKTEQQIRSDLEGAVTKGNGVSGFRGNDAYLRARGQWAAALLRFDDHLGLAGLRSSATTFASLIQVRLTRRGSGGG
jgi:hypothetical protein